MKKFNYLILVVTLFLCFAGNAWGAEAPFNNDKYTYTKLWTSSDSPVRWPDYNVTAGKITWRDGNSNGYVADFNPATKAISNIVQFSTGGVYESSFSADGAYIFYQDASSTTSLSVQRGTVEAYVCYRYDIANSTITTVFDISTIPAATIEALTSYVGDEFGFYLSQGGSNDYLLMSYRASNEYMDIARYNISTKTFTNLTNSTQAEFDGDYFGTDISKLLYWTESTSSPTVRKIAILSSNVESVIASETAPQMYLTSRWGKDQSHILAVKGTGWANSDIVMFTYSDGTWSTTPEDLTGSAWSSTNGGIYAGASTGNGFLFGTRDATTNNGLWFAQEIPTEVWVDDSYTSTSCGGHAWGYDAFTTVQAGIAAVATSGTVNVAAGTYYEEVSITDKNNITITGAGEGSTIIAPYRAYTANNYGIVINNANGIVIQNLTVDGFANAGLATDVAHFQDGIHWDAIGGNNCIITHITVKNIDRRGISVWPETVTNNEVTYCTIDNMTGINNGGGYAHAIKFNGSGKVEHCTISKVTGAILGNCDVIGGTLSIQDNVITDLTGLTVTPFDIGINFWCKRSNVITVKNNSITANVDDNTGIYVVRGGDGSEISYNTLNLTGNGGLGIETGWENTWGFPIHHNNITMGKGGAGIVITGAGSDADPMLLYDNTLTNSGADDSFTNDYTGYSLREVGLLLSGHQYTSRTGDANYAFNGSVYNNTIDGFKDGIVLASQVYNASGYKDVEIKMSDENKITNYQTAARYGYISNTDPYPFTEIVSTDANYALQDLSMNYWGSTSPDFATIIDGKIKYCSYYTNVGLTALGGPVVNANTGVAYCTIQAAIDAATADDVINVAAGTYAEALTVNKANLTIQGAGATSTFITTTTTTPGITVSANGATIKNLGITNATELKEGIRVNASVTNGLNVDHVNFTNLGNGTLAWDDGYAWAYGIHLMGSLTDLDITNCTFDALSATHTANGVYSKGGTTLTDFTLESCTFNNNWNGLFLQSNINGFTAAHNTFGPQEISDMGACVAGIYIGDGPKPFSIDHIVIEDNLFTSYGRGIYFCDYGTDGVIGSVDISDNTFTNSIYSSGIRLMAYDDSGTDGSAILEGPITIDNNTFTQSSPIVNGNGVAMIDLRVGAESSTSDIDITNNDITFTGPFTLSTWGMVFRGPIKKMDIMGNTLKGNDAGGASSNMPATSGIVLQSNYADFGTMSSTADIKILNNTIQGFVNGVAVYDFVTNAYGAIPTGASVDINNNTISGNTNGIFSGTGEVIDAKNNWWGDASGPHNTTSNDCATGDDVSNNVTYTPWWYNAEMTKPWPGTQDATITVTNIKATKADISWKRTAGTGSFVVVKLSTDGSIGTTDLPIDCTPYDHYHTNFTSAHRINGGVKDAKIIQYGPSKVCYLTGLTKLTTYYVRICNYQGDPVTGTAQYNRASNLKTFATPRAKEGLEGTDALAGTFSMGLIAPNPVTDNLNFALEVADEQAFTIEVYDAEGKTVNQYCANQIYGSGTHNININMNNVSSGLYTLVVKSGMDMAFTQFIITK
jgi:hypothetical protein